MKQIFKLEYKQFEAIHIVNRPKGQKLSSNIYLTLGERKKILCSYTNYVVSSQYISTKRSVSEWVWC